VLFVDLVGFTPLAEKRDPEEVRELLSLYFERAQAIIARYGGTVEKFIGDAVMAVWGAPVANEDDAERAVRAALEVVGSVAELGRSVELPDLSARAGVVTGEVAITVGKVAEGMVVGDTVNAASRIQNAAESGTVLVDEVSWRAASKAIVFEEVGALQLKGKAEPVHAWRALRVVAERRGVRRPEGPEPPFVGRDEELRLAKDLLQATSLERRARLVSITGVPGMGKSRLVLEFRKYVDGLAETVYWHEGRSPAYGEGITFWALGEMVRMRARISESEDAASSRSKLTACVAQFVTDPGEQRWVEARLAHLLGLAEAPPGDRNELYSAWRTFFEHISDAAPIIMVFEDLQWADAGLIDFIESILEWSRNHPILVVTLSRPEFMDRRPNWGARQRSFTSIHLEPLTDAEMADLVHGLVEGVPDEVVEAVRARAEGVPLYAVETVRTLVDRGVLVRDDGTYSLVGELGSLEIPDTLHALIASRIDTLPAQQRSLLEDAAVVGRTFTTASLAVLRNEDQVSLEVQLRELVRGEFLSLDTEPRSPERGQYGFVQGLIQEVAYSTLSRRDRSAKHLAVARHLESLADEEITPLVAAHYLEARRAVPEGPEAEAVAVAVAARDWLSRAGKRALSLGSPEQALVFFEQALEMTATGAERAGLLELAGAAAEFASAYDRAITLYEEAIAYYEAAGDRNTVGRATVGLARILVNINRFSDEIERCKRVFHTLGDGGDRWVRAKLACEVAWAHDNAGSYEGALEWSEKTLVLAERLDDAELLARAIGAKAYSLFNLGRYREAVILGKGRVALAAAAGSLFEQAFGWMQLGIFLFEEDPQEAMSAALEAAELSRRAGHRGMEVMSLLNRAEGTLYFGQWDDTRAAITELRQRDLPSDAKAYLSCTEALLTALTGNLQGAVACFEQQADRYAGTELVAGRATYLMDRSLASLATGDIEAARQVSADAVSADPTGINSPRALAIQARACLWLGDIEGVRTALAGLKTFYGRRVAATRLTAEAGLASLERREEDAVKSYRQAIEAWRALECTLDLALCELDLVLLLGPGAPNDNAAKEARDIFTRLGAKPFLERLNRATGDGQLAE